LLAELNFELWMGDAAKIAAKRVRKQKTDRLDAQRSGCVARVYVKGSEHAPTRMNTALSVSLGLAVCQSVWRFDTEEVDGSNPFEPTIDFHRVREIHPQHGYTFADGLRPPLQTFAATHSETSFR
jgi:hypothetical protein